MDATIKSFDHKTIKKVKESIKSSLASVEKCYGITFSIGKIGFTAAEFSARIEARLGSDPEEHAKKDWDNNCFLIGLHPNDFGKEFDFMGNKYKVLGISLRSPKYPLLAKRLSNGVTYKLPANVFK